MEAFEPSVPSQPTNGDEGNGAALSLNGDFSAPDSLAYLMENSFSLESHTDLESPTAVALENAPAAEPVEEEAPVQAMTSSVDVPAASNEETTFNESGRVHEATAQLSQAVDAVVRALDAAEAERLASQDERAKMEAQIEKLQAEVARSNRFRAAVLEGPGGSVTPADLEALRAMTDSLTQDPDRLTVLFGVVQHAPKLAAAVSVFAELRRMAEES